MITTIIIYLAIALVTMVIGIIVNESDPLVQAGYAKVNLFKVFLLGLIWPIVYLQIIIVAILDRWC